MRRAGEDVTPGTTVLHAGQVRLFPQLADGQPELPAAQEIAQSALRTVWRDVGLLERDQRLERHRDPDIGFAEPIFAWASGRPLGEVLDDSGLTAGDFVRWARQVVDFAGQVAQAAGPSALRDVAREVVDLVRRGVVDAAPLED